ncbi:MAG: DUF2141 domain-containing protein [Gallionellaceae bacterium]|nr:DUF2141 domain-containing protein [Gallionellaceae bacterium]
MKRALLALAWSALLGAAALAADLRVAVGPVRGAEGQVKRMLFDRAEGFRKEDQARAVLALPASAGQLEAVFRDLPPGQYAVLAYHDENGNGKLDLRLGMTQDYGMIQPGDKVIVPPPQDVNAAEVRLSEGHECVDWYFCKKSL